MQNSKQTENQKYNIACNSFNSYHIKIKSNPKSNSQYFRWHNWLSTKFQSKTQYWYTQLINIPKITESRNANPPIYEYEPLSKTLKTAKRQTEENAPEFELREAANEGAELVRAPRREGGAIGEVVDLGIDLRREKANEEVEEVDAEAVGDDVETLEEVNADGVD